MKDLFKKGFFVFLFVLGLLISVSLSVNEVVFAFSPDDAEYCGTGSQVCCAMTGSDVTGVCNGYDEACECDSGYMIQDNFPENIGCLCVSEVDCGKENERCCQPGGSCLSLDTKCVKEPQSDGRSIWFCRSCGELGDDCCKLRDPQCDAPYVCKNGVCQNTLAPPADCGAEWKGPCCDNTDPTQECTSNSYSDCHCDSSLKLYCGPGEGTSEPQCHSSHICGGNGQSCCLSPAAPCEGSLSCDASNFCTSAKLPSGWQTDLRFWGDKMTAPKPPKFAKGGGYYGVDVSDIVNKVIGYLFPIAGVIALIFIIMGGYMWIVSAGDPNKVKQAQGTLTWAIVGLVIVMVIFGIIRILINFLS